MDSPAQESRAGAKLTGYRECLRILHLYRPRLPETRAQALQVVHTSHALAARGHDVTVLADRSSGFDGDAQAALAAYGLDQPPGLSLRLAPMVWPPGAGLWFRAAVRAWCAGAGGGRGATGATGSESIVYARAKRYISLIPARVPVVVEAHELDSALEREAGRSDVEARALEAAVFARASAIVTNCHGTLQCIAADHAGARALRSARVIWNATRADRAVVGTGGAGVGVVGSAKEYKGVEAVIRAARCRVVLVGADRAIPGLETVPAVPYSDVPGVLAGFDVLLLPLAANLFGRCLTNPLKLWDYLATDRPLVLPDLPTLREVLGVGRIEGIELYDPADLGSVAPAIAAARLHGPRLPRLRTWDDRARDIESFLGDVVAGGA